MPSLNTKLASAPNTSSNYVLKATSSTTIGNSSIQDTGSLITMSSNVTTTGIQSVQNGLNLGYTFGGAVSNYTSVYGKTDGLQIALANGTGGATFVFQTASGWTYTFPPVSGTVLLGAGAANSVPFFTFTNTVAATSNFVWDNTNGRLGINNSSPSYSLDVTGTGRFTDDVYFTKTSPTLYYPRRIVMNSNADFGINNNANTSTLFYLNSSGQVGIGTTSPGYLLTVKNPSSHTYLALDNTASTLATWMVLAQGGTNKWLVGLEGSSSNFYLYNAVSPSDYRFTVTQSGNVGIGTTNPTAKLHIYGTGGNTQTITQESSASAANAYLVQSSASKSYIVGLSTDIGPNSWIIYDATASTTRLAVTSAGNVLIGTTTDRGSYLTIGGDASTMRVLPLTDNVGYVGESSHRWAAIYAANGTIQTSDGREKTDVKNSILGLDFITKLRPVSYKWIVGENIVTYETLTNEDGTEKQIEIVTPRAGIRNHYGFIAQEVKEVLGDIDFGGYVHDKETDKMSLRYDQFIAPLVKAIQEQNQLIQELNKRIQKLENI